jgi:hypothetical protein
MNATFTLDFYALAAVTSFLCLSLFALGFTLGSVAHAYKTSNNPVLEDNYVSPPSEHESQDSQGSAEEDSEASSQEAPLYLPRAASFRATPALTEESKSPDSPTKHAKGRHEWECVRTILLRGEILTLTQVAEALIPPLYTGDPVKKSGKIIAPHYLKWSLRMGLIEIVPQE